MGRMTTDCWVFRIILDGGIIAIVKSIDKIVEREDGSSWIDVDLHGYEIADSIQSVVTGTGCRPLYAPTTRTTASLNLDSVVAVIELADT